MTIILWFLIGFFLFLLISLVFLLIKFLLRVSEIRDLRKELSLMQQDIHQGLDSRQQELKETLKQSSESYLKMQRELGRLQEIGQDMKGLQEVLQSPKLRGNLGEQVMKDLLEEIIPKGRISCQYYFQDGEAVDAILKTENGLIPIDSKYPLESFRMLKKASEDDKPQWERRFKTDIQKHIKDIARKYIRPDEGTVDFAVMYLPSESVYYEILINHPDILEYSYQQRIYLVSPNTFYYFLKVIMVGLEGAKIEEAARGILRGIQSLQLKTDKLGKRLQVLFGHIGRAYSTSAKVNQEYQQLTNNVRQIRLLETKPPKKIKEGN